jgi:DNA-binding SARP family transcriptional activator/tetratricopeptide (TPR) repeat protein
LALLLLGEGRVVSTDELADAVWGDSVPRAARGTLRTYIHRLRRVLGGDEGDPVVVSVGSGYALPVGCEAVDLRLFRRLVGLARVERGEGRLVGAVERLGEALGLWEGTPLGGVRGSFVEGRREWLGQLRLAAFEEFAELTLELGGGLEVVDELVVAVAGEPLRESLRELLMLALCQVGRQADALRVFEEVRVLLAEELGVDPGVRLREVHGRILGCDPALFVAGVRPVVVEPVVVRPAQLPGALSVFVGREAVLAEVVALLPEGGGSGSGAVVGVVSGMAGVGKTAFAVEWGRRVAHRFPDGQLYVNLRGVDRPGAALEPGKVVRWFLESLGVSPECVPADLASQVVLYRGLLARRRCLVVLDNARDSEQVRLLLPGSAGSLVIVTSRCQLTGLVASDGAYPVTLGLLSEEESVEFLVRRLGAERVVGEVVAAREVGVVCGRLPLALAVVSARVRYQVSFSLSAVVAELLEGRDSLDAFVGLDGVADVRMVFSWSYQALSGLAARMFRLLSVHPGGEFTVSAAANVAVVGRRVARVALRELAGANLLSELSPGRYVCHDLLRVYAAEVLVGEESVGECRAAVRRLLDYFLYSADAVFRLHSTYRDLRRLPAHRADVVPEVFVDYEGAVGWLVSEYRVVMAVFSYVAGSPGLRGYVLPLAWAVQHFQDRRGHWRDLAVTQGVSLEVAEQLGDVVGVAFACGGLARVAALRGCYGDAHRYLDRAFSLFEGVGDDVAMAYHQTQRSSVYNRCGEYRRALCHVWAAIELCRGVGHRLGEAGALNNLGWLFTRLGEHERALVYCGQALVMYAELDNRVGQANTLDSIAHAYYRLGCFEEAIGYYRESLVLLRVLGDRTEEVKTLLCLGEVYVEVGCRGLACSVLGEALVVMEELGHPDTEQVRADLLAMTVAEPGTDVARFAVSAGTSPEV